MKYDTAVPIGQGAAGEVLKAWDPSLKRHVALKLLKSDDPESVDRALREARAQARIHHPNVCKVFEVGTYDERPYIAMEYPEYGGYRVTVAFALWQLARVLRERGADFSPPVRRGLDVIEDVLANDPEDEEAREIERGLRAILGD